IKRISDLGNLGTGSTQSAIDFKKVFTGIGIKEEVLTGKKETFTHVNSVQHNVPAWAIFGMFFIVVPLAGNMIREREDGSAVRIELIPHALRWVALGKILFYTLICTLQFWIMTAIGI